MRFTILLVSGALAAVAVAQSATTSANAPESSVHTCLNNCKGGDVNCQAHCITVPSPNTQNIENTDKCVAACPQGNGSPAETDKYSACVQSCIKQNYYVSSEGTPNATGGSGGSGSGSGVDTMVTPTGTGASPSGTGSGSGSGSGSSADIVATPTGTGASPSGTGSGSGSGGSKATGSGYASGTQTSASASATKTGAAAGLTVGSSGAFVGALAALLAL